MTTAALRSIALDSTPSGFTIVRPLALNWRRIYALCGSFTAHAAIVLLLLIPPVAVQLNRAIQRDIEKSIIVTLTDPEKTREIPLPEPEVVLRRKIAPTHPQPVITIEKPVPTTLDAPVLSVVDPLATGAGDQPATPPLGGTAGIGAGDAAPQAMGYGNVTNIPYPIIALRNHEQGTVLLRVLVGIDGKPISIEIDHSSGSHALDMAARDAVRHWTFKAGVRAGVAYAAWAIVPVSFEYPQ